MSTTSAQLVAFSNSMVALHRQQFGRGPTQARADWAGPDLLVVVFGGALLPAEVEMVRMGEGHRVAEQRTFLQRATKHVFVAEAEDHVGRRVVSFTSACDPESAKVYEIFEFAPPER